MNIIQKVNFRYSEYKILLEDYLQFLVGAYITSSHVLQNSFLRATMEALQLQNKWILLKLNTYTHSQATCNINTEQ